MRPMLLAAAVLLSGCATIGDLEAEERGRERDAKAIALDVKSLDGRLDLWADRVKALEERVRYLEKVVAPNDPDGLLEDPDLYRDASERKRFYRLWERTECGE